MNSSFNLHVGAKRLSSLFTVGAPDPVENLNKDLAKEDRVKLLKADIVCGRVEKEAQAVPETRGGA